MIEYNFIIFNQEKCFMQVTLLTSNFKSKNTNYKIVQGSWLDITDIFQRKHLDKWHEVKGNQYHTIFPLLYQCKIKACKKFTICDMKKMLIFEG